MLAILEREEEGSCFYNINSVEMFFDKPTNYELSALAFIFFIISLQDKEVEENYFNPRFIILKLSFVNKVKYFFETNKSQE